MSLLLEALQSVGVDSPAWLVLCAVLLAIAGAVARRQGQSARRQGARIGRLERIAKAERIRRRQVEAELRAAGIRLPVWPPDRTDDDDLDDDDLDDVDVDPNPPTYRLPTQAFSRHALRRNPQ